MSPHARQSLARLWLLIAVLELPIAVLGAMTHHLEPVLGYSIGLVLIAAVFAFCGWCDAV